MPTLPAISREYLYLPGIQAFDSRSPDAAVDPRTLPVQMAFLTSPNVEPVETDWVTGEWESRTTARILIGPGAVALPAGRYSVWLRVTGAVERPERHVGVLTVR